MSDKRLPNGWRWVRLDEICEIIGGGAVPELVETNENNRIYVLKVSDLNGENSDGRYIYGGSQYISPKAHINRVLRPGAIVFPKRGGAIATNKKRILAVPAILDTNLMGIELKPEWQHEGPNSFLYWWFVSWDLSSIQSGNTIPQINRQDLAPLKFPLAPLPEQKRITTIIEEQMSDIDAARIAIEAELEAAEALSASYLREVFESHEAQDWECVPLLEICQGLGQYGLSVKSSYDSTGLPILGMSNIREGKLIWDSLKYLTHKDAELNKYGLSEGDILFNRTNSAELVGKTAVFDGSRDAVFASYLIRFRAKPNKADPHFISAYINSIGRKFIERNMARAIGQVNISASTMHKMPIPLPPLEVQKAIVNRWANQIEQINSMTNIAQIRLNAIHAMPDAVLRRAFNGDL